MKNETKNRIHPPPLVKWLVSQKESEIKPKLQFMLNKPISGWYSYVVVHGIVTMGERRIEAQRSVGF